MFVVGTTEGQPGLLGVTSLVAAVLRRADLLVCGAKQQDLANALSICEEKCNELQREYEEVELGRGAGAGAADAFVEDELEVLLPAAAEWGAVRALLYSPWHRARVLTSLIGQPYTGESAAGARFWEQQATSLAVASGSAAVARALAQYCPHSHYLNIVGSCAPLWAQAGVLRRLGGVAVRGVAALAALLPALVRALHSNWAPKESEALCRCVRRVLSAEAAMAVAGCGVVGALLRLEAEGHAARPRLPHALYAALDLAPQHKWLYVRGAAWCGGEAAGLADALLDKMLRLHALPHELQPLLDAHNRNAHLTTAHAPVTPQHAPETTEHAPDTEEHAEPDADQDEPREKIEGYIFNEAFDVFDEDRVQPEERRGYELLRDENDAADEGSRGT
ncbi:hypothetical protein RR46_11615 [Papilio xuthus]|uniref:Uncharacterized protein n=1 Tax=Papilio xuthus TaxID=66420 RepID=A0A194PRG5_PAPXU|nr:hypothetical protein RR46_11615 [Papilio xuthus]